MLEATHRVDSGDQLPPSRTAIGFPLGISGQELGARPYEPAQKLTARKILISKTARLTRLRQELLPSAARERRGDPLPTRATEQFSRERRGVPASSQFETCRFSRRGFYYAATRMELSCAGRGDFHRRRWPTRRARRAIFLAETASACHMLIRSGAWRRRCPAT